MKILSNHHNREFISWFALSDAERAEFDYCGEEDTFIRYRGEVIPLCDFVVSEIGGWSGVRCDSYFSAVVIKLSRDGETYRVGLALS